eukprot:scaffold1348_cov323-Prasinococcus_capsulatus_cf.AAC.10
MASSPLFPSSARLATLVSHSNRPHITRSFKVAIVLTLGVFSVLFVGLLHASLYTSVLGLSAPTPLQRAHGTHKGRTQARPLLDTADAYARSDASEALGAFDDDHVLVDRAHVDGTHGRSIAYSGSAFVRRFLPVPVGVAEVERAVVFGAGQYRDRGPFGGSTSTNRKNAQGCEDVRRQNGEYEEQLFNLRIDVESLRKEITYTKVSLRGLGHIVVRPDSEAMLSWGGLLMRGSLLGLRSTSLTSSTCSWRPCSWRRKTFSRT